MQWVYWITGTVGAFGVLEYIALANRDPGKPSGTLTAALRKWLGIDPRHWRRFLLAPAFGLGLATFGSHILLGWP